MIYELHVGTFTREGTWDAAARELPELAPARHHADRGDAGRRIRRPLRLGLRRRRSVRADPPLRHARRLPPLRRRGPRAPASASSSTSSTTTSVRRAITSARSRRATSPTGTRTSGATRSTSTGPTPGRCASSSSPTPATGSTSFISTACASTRRSRFSIARRRTSWPTIGRRARAAAGGRPIVIVAENEPQETQLVRPIERGRLRSRRAVERRLSSQRDGRADRPGRGLLQRHRGEPQEFISAAKYGYLFQGQHYAWQQQPRGTPALGPAAAAFVTSSRTTIRSRTRRSGQRGPRADAARAAGGR